MTLIGTPNMNNNEHNFLTYLSFIFIAAFSSMLSMRSTKVFTTDTSPVGRNYADFFMKNVIISMGNGNTIVEFFSAEIVFRVLRIHNKELITAKANEVVFMNSPEGNEAEVPLASRQLFPMLLVKHVTLFVHLRMQ